MFFHLILYFSLPYPVLAYFCPCVLFNSSGFFHSPNFPDPLDDIPCLFYHFKAPEHHIVRITFHTFSVTPRAASCLDTVRIYDSSREGAVALDEAADFEFCGREIAPGRIFYSKHNHFLLHISNTHGRSKGFKGEYIFIPKKNFTSTAVELSENSYRVEKTKGELLSPDYPYFYPSFINCTYIIPQKKGFEVNLQSKQLQLNRQTSIVVYDTSNGRQQLKALDSESSSLFLTSTSALLLHFIAGDNTQNRATGFVIEFSYTAVSAGGVPLLVNKLIPSSLGVDGECSITIRSDESKTGNFSSKQFTLKGNSHLPTKCTIVFQGQSNEKVSLKFVYFNLFKPDGKNSTKRCSEVDHLTADVRVGARLSRIEEWCGPITPPQLMSSSNLLQVEYITKSSRALRENSKQEIGFRIEYLFHKNWNMDHMQARSDTTKACRFIFNSSVQTSGKLWSVNYPGLYPREMYCEYIFHGSNEQIVHIHFEYFDVEGFNQCDESTQSDFVLFSNYQTHDRTNRRFCGKVAPRGAILSESNYFRMIFFSNDIFDATGFYAHYQFITQQKSQVNRLKLTTTSNFSNSLCFTPFLLIVLLFKLGY